VKEQEIRYVKAWILCESWRRSEAIGTPKRGVLNGHDTNMGETSSSSEDQNQHHIPIEIISDDEMALIEAALAFASTRTCSAIRSSSCSSSPSKSPLHNNALSITVVSKRSSSSGSDIEDLPALKRKHTLSDSFLRRFRNKRGLSVTDITSTVSIFWVFAIMNFVCFGEIGLLCIYHWMLCDRNGARNKWSFLFFLEGERLIKQWEQALLAMRSLNKRSCHILFLSSFIQLLASASYVTCSSFTSQCNEEEFFSEFTEYFDAIIYLTLETH